MGDPRSARRKYQKPSHPWQGERIKREDEFVRKYGLKNKREFWKAESLLRAQRAQAREYLPRVLRDEPQAKREAEALLKKLNRLGMLDQDAGLDDVLALNVEAVLSRRLQTVAFMKGLANTPKQSRQFISHGHIAVGGQRVSVPGYLVTRDEEKSIEFAPTSPLQNPAHPLRQEGPEGAAAIEPGPEETEEVHRAQEMAEAAEAEEEVDVLDEAPEEPDEGAADAASDEEASDEPEEPEEAAEEPEEAAEEAQDEATEAAADDEPEGEEAADPVEEAAEPDEAADEDEEEVTAE